MTMRRPHEISGVVGDRVPISGAVGARRAVAAPLRESVSEPDWYVTLVQMVAGPVQGRMAEWRTRRSLHRRLSMLRCLSC